MTFSTKDEFNPEHPFNKKVAELLRDVHKRQVNPYAKSAFASIGHHNDVSEKTLDENIAYEPDFDKFANSLIKERPRPMTYRPIKTPQEDHEFKEIVRGRALHEHYHENDKLLTEHHSFPAHQINSIRRYTDHSQPLNRKLFFRHLELSEKGAPNDKIDHIENDDMDGEYRQVIFGKGDDTYHHGRVLDSITRGGHTPKELTLYSGVRFHPEEKIDATRQLHLPAYTSSSLSPKVAHAFSLRGDEGNNHHILRIHWPRESNGAYIAPHSTHMSEYEHLLPRGLTLHVHPEPFRFRDNNYHIHIWDAEPLDGHKR